MTPGRLLAVCLVRLLPALVLALPGAAALAQQADPPGRVARLNHVQGPVVFSPAGDNEWTDAVLNRPLTRGDRLWTDRGSRADVQVGSAAVRLDGQTHLEILALDDQSARLSVTQGTVYARVRSLPEGENFEFDTPNLAWRAAYPGDYRIDVDALRGTTRVTIHSGTGAVYGENGQALPLGGGQQITFRGRALAQLGAQESPPQDAFDRWAAERNRLEDQAISARFVPREVVGFQQLDAHGRWAHDLTHGMVWFPQGTPANWAPYRHGHWEWIAPWGWTWIDDAPWGFAPFHYGRWTLIESRWAWVPSRLALRPVYAPALVAFIGGSDSSVAWFPLGPGEAWQPPYRASPVYISNVNRHISVDAGTGYAHQRSTEALTAISAEDFHRGKPMRGGWLRVAANTLSNARIVPPPPMPQRSELLAHQRSAPPRVTPPAEAEIRKVIATPLPGNTQPAPSAARGTETQQAPQADTAAPAQPEAQAQAEARRPSAEQARAQRRQARMAERAKRIEQAQREEQAARERQAKAAVPPRPAEDIPPGTPVAEPRARTNDDKRARQASMAAARQQDRTAPRAGPAQREQAARQAAQARTEQQALQAAQERRTQRARSAEQARHEQVALKAEQLRHEQAAQRAQREQATARRLELARREQTLREQQALRAAQAKRELQARREKQARQEEQLRQDARAQQVEQARRAAEHDAQALREQRHQREEQARREEQSRREDQARRDAQAREQAQREAWQRQQQAISEQWRRDNQLFEQQQRERIRQRPDLRDERKPAPEIWQRGIPILNPGRTS